MGDTWLAQSVECATVDLRVMSSSPTFGAEITQNLKKNKKERNDSILDVSHVILTYIRHNTLISIHTILQLISHVSFYFFNVLIINFNNVNFTGSHFILIVQCCPGVFTKSNQGNLKII